MTADPLDPTGAFAELSGLMRRYDDPGAVLSGVVGVVQRRVAAADDVSVTMLREGRPATVAATGRLAADLDESQYRCGHGPCLDAGYGDEVLLIEDWAREVRWPDYGEHARRLGLGSSLSLPLPVESYLVGALNLYSRRVGAFDAGSVDIGIGLAAQLTHWLGLAARRGAALARAVDLREALQARSLIDRAKGVLMAQRGCTVQEAFALLLERSAVEDSTIAEVAAAVVGDPGTGR